MHRSFGVAVAGSGFMGSVHTEALRRAGQRVVGLLGSSPAKSQIAANELGIERGYVSLDELLADPQVDAVHVAVPNRLHFDFAKRCLTAGKHVLCEKPLAMNRAESAALVALAASRPRQASGVNYNVRFYPLCLEMREQIASGALGRVLHVCGSYVQDWLLSEFDYNWRVLADEGGDLRAVADIGTHWLDLLHAVTGLEVESLCADLQIVHPVRRRPRGEVVTFAGPTTDLEQTQPVAVTTDDYGALLARLSNGARATLWVSQTTAGRKNCLRIEIAAEKASLAWDSQRPDELWIGRRDKANELLPRDPSLLGQAARGAITTPGGHNEGFADTFKQLFRAFYGYIAADDFMSPPPYPTFADGHREIALCEAVLASAKDRRWVTPEY